MANTNGIPEVAKTPSKDQNENASVEATEEEGVNGQQPDSMLQLSSFLVEWSCSPLSDIFQVNIKLPHEPFDMPMTVRTLAHTKYAQT